MLAREYIWLGTPRRARWRPSRGVKYIARKMAAFYGRHGSPKTKKDKKEPDESQEPEVGDVVAVEDGAEVNKNYTMSDDEDDEDGEGAGAAADGCGGCYCRSRCSGCCCGRSGSGLICVLCTAFNLIKITARQKAA
jgi:hypothetical protein